MDDLKLSDHFSFFELTTTGNVALLEMNRREALKYLPSGKALAGLLELIRGDKPLTVNSAFRCGRLNGATPGSSPTSQHPMFQAADIHRVGQSIDDLFAEVLALFKAQRVPFGQLIRESAKRDYGVVEWVHVSLGRDFWKPERCGEVLIKFDDPNTGKPVFQMIEKVPQEAA